MLRDYVLLIISMHEIMQQAVDEQQFIELDLWDTWPLGLIYVLSSTPLLSHPVLFSPHLPSRVHSCLLFLLFSTPLHSSPFSSVILYSLILLSSSPLSSSPLFSSSSLFPSVPYWQSSPCIGSHLSNRTWICSVSLSLTPVMHHTFEIMSLT